MIEYYLSIKIFKRKQDRRLWKKKENACSYMQIPRELSSISRVMI